MQKATCFLFIILLVVTCKRPDVSEQGQFTIIGTCELPGYAEDVEVRNGFAYVANGQAGLQIVNTTNPESTFVVGEYITNRDANGIAVRDTFGYLALTSSTNGGLMVLNIANPREPRFVGQDPSIYAYNVVAPVAETMYVYIAARYWFHVEDVYTYPQYPSYVRRFTTPGDIRGLSVVDSMAYLACEQMGIYVFNLEKPDSEALVGWIDTPSNARNIFVAGDFAYVADGRAGLIIIDITDPGNLHTMGSYDTPEYTNDVFVDGDYAYVADGDGGVQIIDISIPEEPMLYSYIETSYANAIYVKDGLVYVADRDMGLVIIEEEE